MTAFDLIGECEKPQHPNGRRRGWRTHGCRRNIAVSDNALHDADVDPSVEEVRDVGPEQNLKPGRCDPRMAYPFSYSLSGVSCISLVVPGVGEAYSTFSTPAMAHGMGSVTCTTRGASPALEAPLGTHEDGP
jgi:hypothetical protein